jgi:prepilin-type N-terminal cleavage/methylation domain-containing protein
MSTRHATNPNARLATRAYTLAEMLIVIMILGISGALVIPHTSQAQVLRIHAAVRTLVADITFAQTDALAYQQRRAIIFDEELNTYTIAEVVVSSGGNVTYIPLYKGGGPNGQYIVDFDINGFHGARMRMPDFDGDAILIFDEIGAPVLDGAGDIPAGLGSVYIDNEQATFRVDISPFTGQVRVEKVDGLPEG